MPPATAAIDRGEADAATAFLEAILAHPELGRSETTLRFVMQEHCPKLDPVLPGAAPARHGRGLVRGATEALRRTASARPEARASSPELRGESARPRTRSEPVVDVDVDESWLAARRVSFAPEVDLRHPPPLARRHTLSEGMPSPLGGAPRSLACAKRDLRPAFAPPAGGKNPLFAAAPQKPAASPESPGSGPGADSPPTPPPPPDDAAPAPEAAAPAPDAAPPAPEAAPEPAAADAREASDEVSIEVGDISHFALLFPTDEKIVSWAKAQSAAVAAVRARAARRGAAGGVVASTDVILGYLRSLLRAARYVKLLHDRLATAKLRRAAAERSFDGGRGAAKLSLIRVAAATAADVERARAAERALEEALVKASERFQNEAPNFRREFEARWPPLAREFPADDAAEKP